MRLQARGNERWISYEVPRPQLQAGGVQRGTLLFNGIKQGNWYPGHRPGVFKILPRHTPWNMPLKAPSGPTSCR